MIYSGIYKITNIVNGKIYIGSAINLSKRWHCHKNQLKQRRHHSILLQRAWLKYGSENFKFEVIENVDKNILIEREQYYLDMLKPYNVLIGYNINKIAGSSLGRKATEETLAKMRIVQGGENNGMYGKRGIENPNFGSKRTEETKLRMKKAQGKENNPMYGLYGGKNPTSKKVIQKTLDGNVIKIWDSLIDIKRELGFHIGNISSCCNGKIKSSKGFIWRYIK